MNAFNLLLPDGQPSKAWVCDNCRIIARDQAHAERCCTPMPCKFCGEPTETKFGQTAYSTAEHPACHDTERARKDRERMDRAVKLETWDGWVYEWDGGGHQDGYFESIEAYVDHLIEDVGLDPKDFPEWVYVAVPRPGVSLDMASILESFCDDGYEDMCDDLKGTDELSAAINAFNAANASVVVYDADCNRAVRVPRESSTLTTEEVEAAGE